MYFYKKYPKRKGEINLDRPCLTMYATIDQIVAFMPENAIFVESGCYVGGTTKFVVNKLLKTGKSFQYYVIDNWSFSNMQNKPDEDFFEVYKNNIKDVREYVKIVKSHSLDALSIFDSNSVFCCLLDDNHTYSHVVQQIAIWLPKMLDGSFLLGDDYYSEDVKNAVSHYFYHEDIIHVGEDSGFMVVNPKDRYKKYRNYYNDFLNSKSKINIYPHKNPHRVLHNDFYKDGEYDVFQFLIKNFDIDLVFDVGCRTDFFYADSGPDINYHMFEPNPLHYKVLQNRLSEQDYNISINNFGLGDKKEKTDYYPQSESLFDRNKGGIADFKVNVSTLDDYCKNNDISKIDFLSIDTDGYDLKVIKGGMSTLKDTETFIQFEYGPMARDIGSTIKEFYDLFPDRWFYYISDKGLFYIEEPNEDFVYANYLISYVKLHDNRYLDGVINKTVPPKVFIDNKKLSWRNKI